MRVVQAVQSKDEAIAYCTDHPVDVVLMDIHLAPNQLDGIEATLELSLMRADTKVIALTSIDEERVILDTFTAGAVHYVRKSDFRKIPAVVREVMQANSPQSILVKEFIRLKETEQINRLTAAEKEIISLNEEGYGRITMAEKLGKSESTLKNQITAIIRKFQAKSIKEVVRIIKSRGLKNREFHE